MSYTNESIGRLAEAVRHGLARLDSSLGKAPYLTFRAGRVERVIELLEGRLKWVPPADWDRENWGEGCIKALDGDQGVHFEIKLERKAPTKRDVFTIAHELGHLFVHLGYGTERWDSQAEFRDTIMARAERNFTEYEANHFGACFLMPELEFRQLAARGRVPLRGSVDLRPIAEHFGVSELAASIRARFLDLVPW